MYMCNLCFTQSIWCEAEPFVNKSVAAANEWESLRYAADVGASVGLIVLKHSSLSKHMTALDYAIMKRIFDVIVKKLNRAARRSMKLPKKQPISVDSTTITVGKTRLPWALYHGEKTGIELHMSYTNATEIPLKENITRHCKQIAEGHSTRRFKCGG